MAAQPCSVLLAVLLGAAPTSQTEAAADLVELRRAFDDFAYATVLARGATIVSDDSRSATERAAALLLVGLASYSSGDVATAADAVDAAFALDPTVELPTDLSPRLAAFVETRRPPRPAPAAPELTTLPAGPLLPTPAPRSRHGTWGPITLAAAGAAAFGLATWLAVAAQRDDRSAARQTWAIDAARLATRATDERRWAWTAFAGGMALGGGGALWWTLAD